jgi:hypothetical protein
MHKWKRDDSCKNVMRNHWHIWQAIAYLARAHRSPRSFVRCARKPVTSCDHLQCSASVEKGVKTGKLKVITKNFSSKTRQKLLLLYRWREIDRSKKMWQNESKQTLQLSNHKIHSKIEQINTAVIPLKGQTRPDSRLLHSCGSQFDEIKCNWGVIGCERGILDAIRMHLAHKCAIRAVRLLQNCVQDNANFKVGLDVAWVW